MVGAESVELEEQHFTPVRGHGVLCAKKDKQRNLWGTCLRFSCLHANTKSFQLVRRALRAHLWGFFLWRVELQEPLRHQAQLQNLGKEDQVCEILSGQGVIFLHYLKVTSDAECSRGKSTFRRWVCSGALLPCDVLDLCWKSRNSSWEKRVDNRVATLPVGRWVLSSLSFAV